MLIGLVIVRGAVHHSRKQEPSVVSSMIPCEFKKMSRSNEPRHRSKDRSGKPAAALASAWGEDLKRRAWPRLWRCELEEVIDGAGCPKLFTSLVTSPEFTPGDVDYLYNHLSGQ